MNKSTPIIELLDQLSEDWSEEETQCFIDYRGGYILTKAHRFLNDGPDNYRQGDAFGLPPADASDELLLLLKKGCEQLLDGLGFWANRPLKELGIAGCHRLLELFHFKMVRQSATRGPHGGFLDRMEFEHLMDGSTTCVYNQVD